MGMKANSGYFTGTRGRPYSGDAKLMGEKEPFLKYIARRKDIDVNGYYDVIAHGSSTYVQIENAGKIHDVNWRITAKIIKNSKWHKGQAIRLLSCNTGAISNGFAQNLANKLGVPVSAPTDYLFVYENGHYFVEGSNDGGKTPNGKKGSFKTFYPKGGSKR